jgi:hypothetical protein
MVTVPALINGKSVENADVLMTVMGTPIFGLRSIEFNQMLNDMQGVTGTGRDYVSYVNGKLSKSGSVTMLAEECFNIESVAPNKDVTLIPLFPITVTFTDASFATISYLVTAKFKGFNYKTADGDTAMPIDCPLFIASIKRVL